MSRIDDLIARLCPGGVPFRPMGEWATLVRGNGMPRSDFVPEGFGCIHYGQMYTHYGTWATETLSFVPPEKAARLAKVDRGDVIVTNTSETLDDVCKAVAWLGDEQIVTGGHATVVKHNQDPKFVSYYLQTPSFHAEKKKRATGTKVIDVSARSMASIPIPLPPVEVQREIVRVLDTFSELEAKLEAELEAELEARREQYRHYRDALLDPQQTEVATVRFGDVAEIVRGASPRPIQAFLTKEPTGVPWIKIGDVPSDGKFITQTAERVTEAGATKSRRVVPGDFVLSNSMSFGRPYISQIEGCIHDGWLAIKHFDAHFLADYLYHLLRSTPMYSQMAMKASTGTVQNLNADIVKSLVLPMPPRAEQQRVVQVLDHFETMTNDLSVGLPAELAARRKQYEYYRDKLLTFEEAR